ncbi:MAG: hypothetical protein U0556_09610 [Dehalococcoidia bacterium]
MVCPSCGAEPSDERSDCQDCGEPTHLPVVIARPTLPAQRPRPSLPALLRPMLPIAGGVAAVAVTASLAAVGLRWRFATPSRQLRRGDGDDDLPLIEIHESIVIKTRAARVRVQ